MIKTSPTEATMQPKYDYQIDDNDAICPYCGARYQVECEDYSEDSREDECGECGKKYRLSQSFSVTHHTYPDCELNGEHHQFEQMKLSNGKEADFCTVCNMCRSLRA
jgi:uncharacterized Zn-finger protein